MNRKVVTIAAIGLFAALSLGSPLSAAPVATKKSIRIDATVVGGEHCTGKFVLQLGTTGDGGRLECRSSDTGYAKTPEGLEFLQYTERATFTGKAGTFVLRVVGRGYDLGFGTHINTSGTWSVVSGTGDYSGMRGRGRFIGVHDQNKNSEQARFAGTVTLPS
jgi:hypothetical protein